MGNKIITEKDFWRCTGGLMPVPLQNNGGKAKKESGETFITKKNTATLSTMDFSCTKLMLVTAILAAIVAVAVVATGGAALAVLVAAGAAAGAAGAVGGAVLGGLLCGQKVAVARTWESFKSNFMIQSQEAITGNDIMTCAIFGDKITFAPEIKNWWQALAEGGANLIKGVFEGMLAGACIGIGGAGVGGVRSLLGAGGKEAAKKMGLNFLKSAPRSILQNIRSGIAGDWALKGLEATQGWLQIYADTGTASSEDFINSFKESSFADVTALENIATGKGGTSDYLAAIFLLMPGNAPGGKKPKNTNNMAVDGPNNKPKDADGKKKDTDAEDGNTTKNRGSDNQNKKKKGDNDAYEAEKLKANTAAHKAQRWKDYQDRNGKLNYEKWSKKYDTAMKNNSYGLGREKSYREAMGGVSKMEKTKHTYRQIDIAKPKEAYLGQLKTGKHYLTKQAKIDIKKDAWLVKQGYQVEYILEKGGSKPLLEALKKNGIDYHIGPKIP